MVGYVLYAKSLTGQIFDVILMDCRIPDGGGFALVESLQGKDASKKTIMMLPPAHRRSDIIRLRELGVKNYVIKPIKENHLLNSIFVTLGMRDPSIDIKKDQKKAAFDERRLSILAVDDMEDNRLLLKIYFKNTPYQVEFAEDGERAIELYKKKPFDIILMDMEMPVVDGYTATRTIRELEKNSGNHPIPILALTAHASDSDVDKTKAAGCDDHITKPVRKNVLLNAIQDYTKSQSGNSTTFQ
jgi:CheY-like chemotaxis protein